MECQGLQQRVFVGSVVDDSEDLHEVTVTIYERVWSDDHTETQEERFEMGGEFLTYRRLTGLFGKGRIDSLIEDAIQNAR